MKTDFDVTKYRKDFPILNRKVHGKPLIYLDNAATTQKPQSVINTLTRYYSEENANIHRGVYHLSEKATDAFELARTKVQHFIGASSNREIIFVRSKEGIFHIRLSGRIFSSESRQDCCDIGIDNRREGKGNQMQVSYDIG